MITVIMDGMFGDIANGLEIIESAPNVLATDRALAQRVRDGVASDEDYEYFSWLVEECLEKHAALLPDGKHYEWIDGDLCLITQDK